MFKQDGHLCLGGHQSSG